MKILQMSEILLASFILISVGASQLQVQQQCPSYVCELVTNSGFKKSELHNDRPFLRLDKETVFGAFTIPIFISLQSTIIMNG